MSLPDRANAANADVPLEINGQHVCVRALSAREIITLQESALQHYRRQRISTWTRNADLLPPETRSTMLSEAMRRTEEVDVNDLPPKTMLVYSGTDRLKEWMRQRELITKDTPNEDIWKAAANAMLPSDWTAALLDDITYQNLTHVSRSMGYVDWWINTTTSGRLHYLWLAIRRSDKAFTYDNVLELFTNMDNEMLETAFREVIEATKPRLAADPTDVPAPAHIPIPATD